MRGRDIVRRPCISLSVEKESSNDCHATEKVTAEKNLE
jgi:hypothetical protein